MELHKGITVGKVETRRDMNAFIKLPEFLYQSDACWVPPIWVAESSAYRPGRNAVLDRSAHVLLLANVGRRVAGRLVAYVDPQFNAHFGTRTGFFGSFECEEDPDVAAALFSAAEAWLLEQGADHIRGPINPVAECWGVLVDGFDRPPVYMSPHNPPFYDSLLAACGYRGVKDLLAYEADAGLGYSIPERFTKFETILSARRPSLSTRCLDPAHLERDAEHIRTILNAGVDGNWGFVPVGRDEMAGVVRDLKPILEPKAIWFVEDEGVPVACCLGFPDINMILKAVHGRLFPTGAIRLLLGTRKLRDFRLWGLAVLPAYQGLGLDVLLYLRLSESLADRRVRMEANYVLEDNLRMRNALEKLGMKQIKRYRVYEKTPV